MSFVAFELVHVGLPLSDEGPEGYELISWQGLRGEVSNIAGGTHEERRRLLAVIAGRRRPIVGRCRVSGHDLETMPLATQRALRHRIVGSVLCGDALFPHLSLRENVALPLIGTATADSTALTQAQVELEHLGLERLGDALPASVEASEARLARIAMALVHRPRVCVVDMPEESLSNVQMAMLQARLRQAARADGVCVVMCTAHSRFAGLASTTLYLPKRHAVPVQT